MSRIIDLLVAFVALFPLCTAALWIAGGILFRLFDERLPDAAWLDEWPGVTVLIPAYNEAKVIASSVAAALAADYPELELLVLDDGSVDDTAAAAEAGAAGDPRCRVIRDPVNRGKADRLNEGFRRARHGFVCVTDADTHMHPQAIKFLVARMSTSPQVAAVAGAPHVTNRRTVLAAMQILEVAAIVGLIRRTHSLTGRVGVVAGVIGLFRRERVLAVGGYDPKMATEDIDLTWKLLLAGWYTAYEPGALVGMQVPTSLRALWAQRKRWARGQGESLHVHLREMSTWRHRRLWLVSIEAVVSLVWVLLLIVTIVLVAIQLVRRDNPGVVGVTFAWGVAIAVMATVQLGVALALNSDYEPRALNPFLLGPLYPAFFWMINAAAAVHSQVRALVRGPAPRRVVWDIPREPLGSDAERDAPTPGSV